MTGKSWTAKVEQRRAMPRPPRPDRCHPTLYARFVDERLVEVWHHHAERRSDTGVDPGCHGPCVGTRDVLPLSYLDKGVDHEIRPLRPVVAVRA